jgi:hypothetical protein
MILTALCEIKKNVPMDGYAAVEGINTLSLYDENGDMLAEHIAQVVWIGRGSPYPTPPGGPWETIFVDAGNKEFRKAYQNFGRCFFVHSDMETEIFIHFAKKQSMGCLIINPTLDGKRFMETLIKHKDGLEVQQLEVIDSRSESSQAANQIDYAKIGRIA